MSTPNMISCSKLSRQVSKNDTCNVDSSKCKKASSSSGRRFSLKNIIRFRSISGGVSRSESSPSPTQCDSSDDASLSHPHQAENHDFADDAAGLSNNRTLPTSSACVTTILARPSSESVNDRIDTTKTSNTGPRSKMTRRHSYADMTSANKQKYQQQKELEKPRRASLAHSQSAPVLEKNVSFYPTVSFAVIPSLNDISERIFLSGDDYAKIRKNRNDEVQLIKNYDNGQDCASRTRYPFALSRASTKQFEPGTATSNSATDDDIEEITCDWGIEHHLVPSTERTKRALQIRNVIDAVLEEQDLRHHLGQDLNDSDTAEGIATASIKASEQARLLALERATQAATAVRMIRRHSAPDLAAIGYHDDDYDFIEKAGRRSSHLGFVNFGPNMPNMSIRRSISENSDNSSDEPLRF